MCKKIHKKNGCIYFERETGIFKIRCRFTNNGSDHYSLYENVFHNKKQIKHNKQNYIFNRNGRKNFDWDIYTY